MISTQFSRFVHLTTNRVLMGASKSNLAKLRKKTGYPFGNCKKALEENNNDLEKAEKWLEDQAKALGWSKAMKMENRNTPQGLVGIAWDKQYAAMVEVNCETDFVSKNDKFQKLVDVVAKTCLQRTKVENPTPKSISKVSLDTEEVSKLVAADQQSLSDHLVKTIAMVGERLVLRRAALVSVHHAVRLAALTHPAPPAATNLTTQLGKYGAVLIYLSTTADEATSHLAKQLCQHIIGMNPTTIDPLPGEDLKTKPKPEVKKKPVSDDLDESESEVEINVREEEEEETVMLKQTFLLDPDRQVADVVTEAGIKVEDFVRFECGEGIGEAEEVRAKAARVGEPPTSWKIPSLLLKNKELLHQILPMSYLSLKYICSTPPKDPLTFLEAQERVKSLKGLTTEELLELYALYKQANSGDINTDKPGKFDLKGGYKWEFWNKKKGMSKESAEEEYIKYVKQLLEKYTHNTS